MDIYLDDKTSLHLLRKVRTDSRLKLTPTEECCPKALGASPIKLHKLGVPHLLSYLRVPDDRSLGVVVPKASQRVRVHGITCSVKARLAGECTFLALDNARENDPSPLVPEDGRVLVMPPECVVLNMAARLLRGGEADEDRWPRLVLMLTKLCLELCGKYSHDPFDPWKGSVTYKVAPSTSVEKLRDLAQALRASAGLGCTKK